MLHGDVQVALVHHRIPPLVHRRGLHASRVPTLHARAAEPMTVHRCAQYV